jgi:flagellar protein FliO/FliZ
VDVSLVALLVRVVVSLGVVLGIMAGAAAVLRRQGVGGGRSPRRRPARIEILGRQGLSRSASVTVVRLGDRALVLGVTESSVNLLAEVDPAEIEPEESEGPGAPGTAFPGSGFPPAVSAWKAAVENLRARTVRRS